MILTGGTDAAMPTLAPAYAKQSNAISCTNVVRGLIGEPPIFDRATFCSHSRLQFKDSQLATASIA
jgi:hypothetical protein